jgi:hypothetical protein
VVQEVVALVAGSGFAAGVNLYATVLLLGIYGRLLEATDVPEMLSSTPVLVIAGVLTAIEFVADKVPWFDSAWDSVHTFIRPVGAAALAMVLVDGDASGLNEVAAGGIAAVLAFIAHSAKASTRVAVNASPEPVSNSIVSLLEDGLVATLVFLAIEHPVIALGAVGVLAVASLVLVIALWRLVRSWRRRRRNRRPRDTQRYSPGR